MVFELSDNNSEEGIRLKLCVWGCTHKYLASGTQLANFATFRSWPLTTVVRNPVTMRHVVIPVTSHFSQMSLNVPKQRPGIR